MTQRLLALCGVLTLLATIGCGNKGPLYLPETTADPLQTAEPEQEAEE